VNDSLNPWSYFYIFLHGAGITLALALAAGALALVVGIVAGVALYERWPPLSVPVRCYVEFFRGSSALIQLFFLYFVSPQIGLTLDPFSVAILGLGLNSGAYTAEFVCNALRAVSKDQIDAGRALGFTTATNFVLVIFPQAVPRMLPMLANQSIDLLKLTSIVSLISINDLTFAAYQINQVTLRTMTVFAVVLAVYFIFAQAIGHFFRRLERRAARGFDRRRT
jgi:polar amino acid transport system permease protein